MMRYDDIDFNKLYSEQKELSSFKMKTKEAWNTKAVQMNKHVHASIYNEEFLQHSNIKSCETLLDVGCGVGNLSIRLSQYFEKIYALDYSSEMLELLAQNLKEKDIKNIEAIEKSWEDSWEDLPKTDLVIASRSMEVKDMKAALSKLHNQAKKRVIISYKLGGSFLSEEILDVLHRDIVRKPDYIYLLNILYQMGINAKVDFIRSESKNVTYENLDSFLKSVEWSVGELNSKEKEDLEEYFKKKKNEDETAQDYITWALISWDKI